RPVDKAAPVFCGKATAMPFCLQARKGLFPTGQNQLFSFLFMSHEYLHFITLRCGFQSFQL
ncbi:MAG: hypothetical protein WAX70_09950, partial [Gemmiger qucibialis]